MEKWITVPGFEGFYECSSEGRVRSLDRLVKTRWPNYMKPIKGKVLKPSTKQNGYVHIVLCFRQSRHEFLLHRLIYESFNGKTDLQVDHINNIISDCRLVNLQALSSHDNNIKAKGRKAKTSIYPGVHRVYNGKWKAQIGINNVKYSLGTFMSQEDARDAYLKARGL